MFKDDYRSAFSKVTASEDTYRRVMNMSNRNKPRRSGSALRKVLIAAAIISLLVVMVGAAEYAGGWFIRYTAQNKEEPLTDSQIAYVEENVQENIAAPADTAATETEDFRVEVKSALTDGRVAYLTIALTAPEGVKIDYLNSGDEWGCFFFQEALLIPEDTTGLTIAPDGSSPDALCENTPVDDGDGLSNTHDLVFRINPFTEDPDAQPFAQGKRWKLHLKGIELSVWNYSDRSEDSRNTAPESEDILLTEDSWDFDLTFQESDTERVELVSQPIRLPASKWLNDEYVYEVELTSFTLGALSKGIEFAPTDPEVIQELEQAETELGAEVLLDIGDVKIVMKDGREVTLLRVTSYASSFGTPIVLEEVDYVLLADGTKLPMPVS